MSDTDEPTQIETLLHNTRAHSSDGWRKLSKSLIELSADDRLLIEYAPTLRAEVKRLREALTTLLNDCEMILDGDDMSGMSDQQLFGAMKSTILSGLGLVE